MHIKKKHTLDVLVSFFAQPHSFERSEFFDLARDTLDSLTQSQQKYVYSLLKSKSQKVVHCAIQAITLQRTWQTPTQGAVLDLQNIALHNKNSEIRFHATWVLGTLNVSKDILRPALQRLVQDKKFTSWGLFAMLVIRSNMTDDFCEELKKLCENGFLEWETLFDECVHAHQWNELAKTCLQKIIEENVPKDYGFWSNVVKLNKKILAQYKNELKLLAIRSIASCSVRDHSAAFAEIILFAGKTNCLDEILGELFKKIESEYSSIGPDNDFINGILRLGDGLAKNDAQIRDVFHAVSDSLGVGARTVIMSTLLRMQQNAVDKKFVEKIVSQSLKTKDILNRILAIALCNRYHLPIDLKDCVAK